MALTVYSGDKPRIAWEIDLPPIGENVTSPDFPLFGSNCKMRFWRVQHQSSKEYWIMILLKSSVTSICRRDCVKIYIVNKFGSLILLTNTLIPESLDPTTVQIFRATADEIKEYAYVVPEDKLTFVFDFWCANFSEVEETATQVKEVVHVPLRQNVRQTYAKATFPSTKTCTDSLVEDLQRLLEEDRHHDVVLKCEGRSIPSHRTILSARSTVFAAMLKNDMREGLSGVVDIADMDFPVFQHFLRYIYCGTLPELTVELAERLYKAGDKYAVTALMKRCSQFMVESLTVDNACEFLALADDHSDQNFKESVISYIVVMEVPKVYGSWTQFSSRRPLLSLEVLNRYVFRS